MSQAMKAMSPYPESTPLSDQMVLAQKSQSVALESDLLENTLM